MGGHGKFSKNTALINRASGCLFEAAACGREETGAQGYFWGSLDVLGLDVSVDAAGVALAAGSDFFSSPFPLANFCPDGDL
jgi:hypothetical protein